MELNYTAQVLIDLAITLLAAFCLSRIAKRLRLPNVTGYILAGILIGPHCLKLIDAQTVEAMSFLTDAALAFIAFGGQILQVEQAESQRRAGGGGHGAEGAGRGRGGDGNHVAFWAAPGFFAAAGRDCLGDRAGPPR